MVDYRGVLFPRFLVSELFYYNFVGSFQYLFLERFQSDLDTNIDNNILNIHLYSYIHELH